MSTGNGSKRTGTSSLRMNVLLTVCISLTCLYQSHLIRAATTTKYTKLSVSPCIGNDIKLRESKQLDECNNNFPDDKDVVVRPSAPHSKSSSNTSSPLPSLGSSPSSSPLSPSSTSSSDAVSPRSQTKPLQISLFFCSFFSQQNLIPSKKQ